MNYIGSKHNLRDFIQTNLELFCGTLQTKSICDLFSGMGNAFSNLACKELIVNDIEFYSYVILKSRYSKVYDIKDLLDTLNEKLTPKKGLITTYFSTLGDEKRNYFSPQNAQKIDAIREKIQTYKDDKGLYVYLLSSLLEACDRVANTASMYGSFLKDIKQTAKKPLFLKQPKNFQNSAKVFNENGLRLLKKITGDILYLDPPYNHRQYGLNYHVLNAIAKYEEFSPRGICGYDEYFRSRWCQARFVKDELAKTIDSANFRYIALSYSSDGLLKPKQIKDIMVKYGSYKCLHVKHDAFRMQKSSKRKTVEYLHLLEKR